MTSNNQGITRKRHDNRPALGSGSTSVQQIITDYESSQEISICRLKCIPAGIANSSILGIPQGIAVGNSIMAGTGATGFSQSLTARLGVKLQAYTGVGTSNDWTPENRGVGGSRTSTCVGWIADIVDPTDVRGAVLTNPFIKNKNYCLIMTLRNDLAAPAEDTLEMLMFIFRNLRAKGVEAILITDPPRINVAGKIDDSLFKPFYDVALFAAVQEGATVVDVWKYFTLLENQGTDISQYYSDFVHLNDSGYDLVADLVFKSMTSPVNSNIPVPVGCRVRDNDYNTVFLRNGGTVSATSIISTTATTSRQVLTGESEPRAYVMNDGDTLSMRGPSTCTGLIIHLLGGVSGNIIVRYRNQIVSAANQSSDPTFIREFSRLSRIPTSQSVYDTFGDIRIDSVGTNRILGVTFLCSRVVSESPTWLDATESGTWSDSTLGTSGLGCRQSSTIGDFVEVRVFGRAVSIDRQRDAAQGRWSQSFDGGSAEIIDNYIASGTFITTESITFGTEDAWHTVRYEVLEKNASSSGNTVKLGTFRVYSGNAYSQEEIFALNAGQSLDMRKIYTRADVVKTISGTPQAYDGISGTDFTLNGTGSAVVRLT